MSITINNGFLCDLVRQEANGKFIAVGIYSSAVIFASFPGTSGFTLLASYEADKPGAHKIVFRTLVGGEENQRLEGEIEVVTATPDLVPLPVQPIQFVVPTTLSFEYQDDEGNWHEFFQINVTRPPTASPQPS